MFQWNASGSGPKVKATAQSRNYSPKVGVTAGWAPESELNRPKQVPQWVLAALPTRALKTFLNPPKVCSKMTLSLKLLGYFSYCSSRMLGFPFCAHPWEIILIIFGEFAVGSGEYRAMVWLGLQHRSQGMVCTAFLGCSFSSQPRHPTRGVCEPAPLE